MIHRLFSLPRFKPVILTACLLLSVTAASAASLGAGGARGVNVDDLGPGLLSFQINGTKVVGDTHYVVSRRMVPATILGYNLEEKRVTLNREVVLNGRRTSGGRGMAAVGHDLYIAMAVEGGGNSMLVRLDTRTGELEEVSEIAARVVWDMAASADGFLYLATSRQTRARVLEFDTSNRRWRDLGAFETHPRQDARSIAVTAEKVYVGIGYNAIDLWSVDRRTGERQSILAPELRDVFWLYTLDANEKWLAAGTTGPNARVAVIDRGDYGNYRLIEHGNRTVQELTLANDAVYFGSGAGVWRYDIPQDSLDYVDGLPVNRGVFVRNGRIHGAAGTEKIGWYDPVNRKREMVNLLESGAEVGSEPAQSLAAGGGKAYFGGRSLGVRDLDTGELEVISAPGEAKSMVVVDGLLYMGMYTSGRLASYDPATGRINTLAEAPEGQLRPRIVYYDEAHRLLLMGTQADEIGGGALTVYELDTGESHSYVDPLGDRAIATIASGHGVVYLAAQRGDGALAAWQPRTREWLWQLSPPAGEWFMGLAVVQDLLYAFTDRGTLAVIDPARQEILQQRRVFPGGGRLLAHGGVAYGVTNQHFFRIDPATHQPEVLLSDLNSRWFPGWPTLAVDENGSFYVIRVTNVLKVDLPSPQ